MLKSFKRIANFILVLVMILTMIAGFGGTVYAANSTVNPTEDTTSFIRNPATGWVLYVDFQQTSYKAPAYELPFNSGNAAAYWAEQGPHAANASIFYVRVPWSQLEPVEGQYAWNTDDNFKALIQGALDRGLKLAFRVVTDSADNYSQATPDFVRQAGAQGYYNDVYADAQATISTTAGSSVGALSAIDDGDRTSGWASSNGLTYPQYITYDFGANTYQVNKVTLTAHYGQGQGITNADVQYWNGSAWVNAVSNAALSWNYNDDREETKEISFTEVSTSKIRLKVNSANLTWGHFGLNEMTVQKRMHFWTPYQNDAVFHTKFENFLTAFAAKYDNPDQVDFIDAMGMGWWGEMHHLQVSSGTFADVYTWITNAYKAKFKKVLLGTQLGGSDDTSAINSLTQPGRYDISRRDAFGSPQWFTQTDRNNLNSMFENSGVPVFAENCYHHFVGWTDPWKPYYSTVRDMCIGVINDAEACHANTLDLRVPEDAHEWVTNQSDLVQKFYRQGGYRLVPTSVSYPQTITDNSFMTVSHTWKNSGWGRMPNNRPEWNWKYKVAYALLNTSTGQPVFVKVTDTEPSGWLKGNSYPYNSQISFGNIPNGTYDFAVAIVDTTKNNTPAINLAVTNTKTSTGWYKLGQTTVSGIATTAAKSRINLLTNPGFEKDCAEVQTPSGWGTWDNGGNADADFTQAWGVSHSGIYHGSHYKNSAYKVYTSQLVTGLANGTYTATAWVKSGGGQNEAFLEAKDNGGAFVRTNIATASNWTQITVPNIQVTNGQCRIGFYSDGNAGNWMFFDDVELYKN